MRIRLLENAAATLTFMFPTAVDSATVTVTRSDGVVIATDAPATPLGGGAFSYVLTPTNTNALETITATWTNVTAGTFVQTYVVVDAFTHYADPDDLRLEPGLSALTDSEAIRLLNDAEDLIDKMLGARSVEDTGRKVDTTDIEGWQLDKLSKATVRLAAQLNSAPSSGFSLAGSYTRIKGPDFEVEGPIGIAFGADGQDVTTLVFESGLAVRTARAR